MSAHSRLVYQGACDRYKWSMPKALAILHVELLRNRWFCPYQTEWIQCELAVRGSAIYLSSQSRSPWHGKCARALIESFVKNRTQLLRPVIQSRTMSSRSDTSLSRNACSVHRLRYARSYLETRSEMQIEVSSHNWSSLSSCLYLRIGRGQTRN